LTDTLVKFFEAAVAASLAFENTLFMFDPANLGVEPCAWRFLEERGWERTVSALLRIVKSRASGCFAVGLYMHNGDNLKLRMPLICTRLSGNTLPKRLGCTDRAPYSAARTQ
jgi:hypothetical protein